MREHFQHVLQQRKFCANVGGTWVFFLAGEQKEMLDDDWRCVDFVVEMWFVEQFWWNKNMPSWLIVILMLILWHGKELARLAVCCNVFCTCPKKHKFASGKLLKLQVFYWGIPLFKLPFAVSSVVFFFTRSNKWPQPSAGWAAFGISLKTTKLGPSGLRLLKTAVKTTTRFGNKKHTVKGGLNFMKSRSEWIYIYNQENVLPSLTHNIQKQKTTRWFQPNLKNLPFTWIIFPGKGKNKKN